MLIYRITTPAWGSVVAVNYGTIIGTTARTKFMIGWRLTQVLKYAEHFGWIVEQIPANVIVKTRKQMAAAWTKTPPSRPSISPSPVRPP